MVITWPAAFRGLVVIVVMPMTMGMMLTIAAFLRLYVAVISGWCWWLVVSRFQPSLTSGAIPVTKYISAQASRTLSLFLQNPWFLKSWLWPGFP